MNPAFVFHTLPVRISQKRTARRTPRATSSVSPQSPPETANMQLAPGQRVRVSASVIMYHYPEHRNEEFDVQGLEGEIWKDVSFKNGVEMSATKPFVVKFKDPKFMAHFDKEELEAI